MENFTTKYSYPALAFLVLMFLLWTAGFIYFIFRISYLIPQQSTTSSLKLFSGGIVILGYLFMLFGQLALIFRYSLLIIDNRFFLEDNLFFQKKDITGIIKGYSKTSFGQKRYSKNTLILYLENGKKINLPKFMMGNFGQLEQKLLANNVVFLGEEVFKWKDIFQRKYQFG